MYASTEPLSIGIDLVIDGAVVRELEEGVIGFRTSGYGVVLVENPAAGIPLTEVELGQRYAVAILDVRGRTASAYPLSKSYTVGTPEEFLELQREARDIVTQQCNGWIRATLEHGVLGYVSVKRNK